jgi:hypothetical protein
VSDTIIVSAPAYLPALREQGEFDDALTFSDGDALKALEAIIRERPKLIVLEQLFAATSRGAALIKRIAADPTLRECEIRVMSHDGSGRTGPAASDGDGPTDDDSARRLDEAGTRRAPRARIAEGVEALIDGSPATLVDVSVVGAQVVSPTILRPNQRARMVLPGKDRPIRVAAVIAWSAFEMPPSGPQYRAGIEFYDAELDEMERFIARYKALGQDQEQD